MKTTHLTPTTPRMGDMIDLENHGRDAVAYVYGRFHESRIHGSYLQGTPSDENGYWLCWTEDDTFELGEHAEHLQHLGDIESRVLIIAMDGNKAFLSVKPSSTDADPTNTRTAYADNINYYKRMIQQGTYAINRLTEQEAYRKLGYWEGRYDELTTGGVE